jgi:hypothetical protein
MDAADYVIGIVRPDPAAKARLDDLFRLVLSAATESGWLPEEAAELPFPPGSRHATLRRAGDELRLLAALNPKESAIIAWAFRTPDI